MQEDVVLDPGGEGQQADLVLEIFAQDFADEETGLVLQGRRVGHGVLEPRQLLRHVCHLQQQTAHR